MTMRDLATGLLTARRSRRRLTRLGAGGGWWNWGTQAMRLYRFAFIALLLAPALTGAQENLGTYEDRVAIEDVMARYVWAVDSLDPEGYVAVFTEDAIID